MGFIHMLHKQKYQNNHNFEPSVPHDRDIILLQLKPVI